MVHIHAVAEGGDMLKKNGNRVTNSDTVEENVKRVTNSDRDIASTLTYFFLNIYFLLLFFPSLQ